MSAMAKKVVKDIARRKVRTVLTIIGIAIGIIGLSAINVASNQFRTGLAYSANMTSVPDMHIYTDPTNPDFTSVLLAQPNIKAVQAEGSIVTSWAIGQDTQLIQILGLLDFQHLQMNRFQLVEGSLPGPGQIVLETGARSYDNVPIGGTISVQAGRVYRNLTVSGYVQTQGRPVATVAGKGYGYMAESSFEQVFNRHGVTDFAIQLDNYDARYQTLDQLSAVMQADHHPIEGTDVGRDEGVANTANGIFAIMDLLSVVAIVISVILLLGTISSLVTEQIKIIGTMKALGGQRGQIMRHYLALVFFYSIFGTAIGLVAGVAGGYLLALYLGSLVSLNIGDLQILPWQILESVAVGIGTPLLATLIPVWVGTRITARQALQGYGLENTASARRGGWASISRVLFGMFPQTIQAGVRGVFRKRLRTVLTMVSLAIAGASLFSVQTASYSFNTFLNHIYDVYHFDAMVSLSDPVPFSQFQQTLGSVQGVQSMESIFQDTASTQWGQATMTGVQIDTRMYHKDLVAGRWFTTTDQNAVIISQDAASKSGLTVGDSISFSLGVNKARWHIIGVARDFSGIGAGNLGVLIAPIGQFNSLLQIPTNATQSVMIQSAYASPTAAQLDTLTQNVDNAMTSAGFIAQVTTPQQLIAQEQSKYGIIYIMLDAVAIIIALVGAIGLSNSLSMSVLERRREIGILRSMGAVRRKIVQLFWAEGTMLGLLAWILAVVIGIPEAYGLVLVQAHVLAPVPFAFNSLDLLWTLVIILVLAALASAGPVLAAVRVKIVQTLSYE